MINDFNSLVNDSINLVHYFARKIAISKTGFYDYDDIFQIGSVGLVKAAKTYNGTVKFSTYASRCINNEIYMFFKRKRLFEPIKSLNELVYEDDDIEFQDVLPADISIEEMFEDLNQIELAYTILLNNFSYEDIIYVLYMADSRKQVNTCVEFNVSQSYVSKSVTKSISKIKKYMRYSIIKKRIFSINISTERSQISFFTYDKVKLRKVFNKLKKQFSYIKELEIIDSDSKFTISISNYEYLLDIVIFIIKNIYYSSIVLLEDNYIKESNI